MSIFSSESTGGGKNNEEILSLIVEKAVPDTSSAPTITLADSPDSLKELEPAPAVEVTSTSPGELDTGPPPGGGGGASEDSPEATIPTPVFNKSPTSAITTIPEVTDITASQPTVESIGDDDQPEIIKLLEETDPVTVIEPSTAE
jgi:hypothetical protein